MWLFQFLPKPRNLPTLEERRKYVRLNVTLELLARREASGSQFRLLSQNINKFGVKFVSPRQLMIGEKIEVVIFLRGKDTIQVKALGHVVWSHPITYAKGWDVEGGLEFIKIAKSGQELIDKFCREYCKSFWDVPPIH